MILRFIVIGGIVHSQNTLISACLRSEDVVHTDRIIGASMKNVVDRDQSDEVLKSFLQNHVTLNGEYYLQSWMELVPYCKEIASKITVPEERIIAFFQDDSQLMCCYKQEMAEKNFPVLREVYNILRFSTKTELIREICTQFGKDKAKKIAERNKERILRNLTYILVYLKPYLDHAEVGGAEISEKLVGMFVAITQLDRFQLGNLQKFLTDLIHLGASQDKLLS